MWKQVRGLGLAYHYNIYINVQEGLLYFVLYKSTHLFKAYLESQKIIDGFLLEDVEFDPVQLESAISSTIFEIVEDEDSVFDAATQSLLSEFRQVDHNYNRELMAKVSNVTEADLTRVAQSYIKPLFEPTKSCCAICCNPSKVDETTTSFKEMGRELKVISSLDLS
jgi:Zn-dependent M16 (insulinase) family peptidase